MESQESLNSNSRACPCSTVSAPRTLIFTSTRNPSRLNDRHQTIDGKPPEIHVADAPGGALRAADT